jgi:hypothetical protein
MSHQDNEPVADRCEALPAERRGNKTDGHGQRKFHTLRVPSPSMRIVMIKAISLALIAGGVVLLYFGGQSFHSLASDVTRAFTGTPTDKTIWLIAGGVVATLAGLTGLVLSLGRSGKR